jgi:glycosyltransferase involved in cell wall biosynthesis
MEESQVPLLSIVLPSYKKANVLSETIVRLYSELNKGGLDSFEVIVIIDGILDNSLEILKSLEYKNLQYISYEKNQGKGFAIRQGWLACRGDFIGYIDCDLDIHPSAINYAISILTNDPKISGVVGSKWISIDHTHYPVLRRIASRMYRRISKMLLKLSVSDTQTGFKMFSNEVAKSLLAESTMSGFAWDLEICAIAAKHGFIIEEIPVILSRRTDDKSSLEFRTAIQALIDIFAIRNKMRNSG